MDIVFFSIGSSIIIHMQTLYALLNIKCYSEKDDNIFIITDTPVIYLHIPNINIIELTAQDIQAWKGEKNYFFRAKIEAIRKFAYNHNYNNHLVFFDSDTYCLTDISSIKKWLNEGYGVMHKDEGSMDKKKLETKKMWIDTQGKVYAGIKITDQFHMWNSGVVAIPKEKTKEVMDTAISLCDSMLNDNVTCFTVEQWCVSIALSVHTKGIMEAHNIIGHYWHHKYIWGRYISQFFINSYVLNRSVEDEMTIIKKTNHKYLAIKLGVNRTIRKLLFLIH